MEDDTQLVPADPQVELTPPLPPQATETPPPQDHIPAPEAPDTPEKREGKLKKVINKLTREKYEAIARAKLLEEQIGKSQQPPAARPSQEPTDDAPKREQFDTWEEYVEARADWKAQKAVARSLQEHYRKGQEALNQHQYAELLKGWQQRLDEAEVRYPDLADEVQKSGIKITSYMGYAIMESPVGVDIVNYLAKNPAEAARISQLSATGSAREIGKIEAKLTVSNSGAPKPIEPLNAGGSINSAPAELSMGEWIKRRNQELRKRH